VPGNEPVAARSVFATGAKDVLPLYVEVSPLLARHLTGIARFAARLVEALARLTPLCLFSTVEGDFDGNMRWPNPLPSGYEIAVDRPDIGEADGDLDGWTRRLLGRPRRRHDAGLAGRCAALYTMLRPARRHFRREFCLLHDFTPLLMPWAHVALTRSQFGALFGHNAGLCDALLADSRSTQSDAGWLCSPPAEGVVLGYPGPTLCVRGHAHPGPVVRGNKGILVVSTVEPRKNGLFLLDWFLHTQVLGPAMELWWVGPSGWMNDLVKRARRRSRQGGVVRFLGVQPDAQLCRLYRAAAFTIYPSLYEGFGFPVLDALRHGTPVVSSFHSSLQEFAGPGVSYFDPCDADSLDAACREVFAAQPAPVNRNDLDRRFSWDALARTVVSLAHAPTNGGIRH
jgi:glycosyltransferase involved in cell wall biosynthesis